MVEAHLKALQKRHAELDAKIHNIGSSFHIYLVHFRSVSWRKRNDSGGVNYSVALFHRLV